MILVSTLHDADGSLYHNIATAAEQVHKHYDRWVVRVTSSTNQRVIDRLKQYGIIVIGKEAQDEITDKKRFVENDHLIAFRAALGVADELGDNIIQYQDGDRVIMATNVFPQEFAETAELVQRRMKEHEGEEVHLNLRRSGIDYLTHHWALLRTEMSFNVPWSKALGMPEYDIGSTNHAVTREVMRAVTNRALELRPVAFPHPKLPIIARQMGAILLSDETYGVGAFETPFQMRNAVKAEVAKKERTERGVLTPNMATRKTDIRELDPESLDHDYQLLTDTFRATLGLDGRQGNLKPEEWDARFKNVEDYLGILGDHVGDFVDDPSRQREIKNDIEQELASVVRERDMLHALWPEGKLPEDPRASMDSMLRAYAGEFELSDPRNRDEGFLSTAPDARTRPGKERF